MSDDPRAVVQTSVEVSRAPRRVRPGPLMVCWVHKLRESLASEPGDLNTAWDELEEAYALALGAGLRAAGYERSDTGHDSADNWVGRKLKLYRKYSLWREAVCQDTRNAALCVCTDGIPPSRADSVVGKRRGWSRLAVSRALRAWGDL